VLRHVAMPWGIDREFQNQFTPARINGLNQDSQAQQHSLARPPRLAVDAPLVFNVFNSNNPVFHFRVRFAFSTMVAERTEHIQTRTLSHTGLAAPEKVEIFQKSLIICSMNVRIAFQSNGWVCI
jgi:hypothetical protein